MRNIYQITIRTNADEKKLMQMLDAHVKRDAQGNVVYFEGSKKSFAEMIEMVKQDVVNWNSPNWKDVKIDLLSVIQVPEQEVAKQCCLTCNYQVSPVKIQEPTFYESNIINKELLLGCPYI